MVPEWDLAKLVSGVILFVTFRAGVRGTRRLLSSSRQVETQNPTFFGPFSFSIARASSGVATARPSSSRMRRILAT